jgi:hypothetical protein
MRLILIPLLTLTISACAIEIPMNGYGGSASGGSVTVCHKGKKTLKLPQEAARAHTGHGDTYGPC